MEITQEDLDRLVAIGESDPVFKNALQVLDVLANKRGIELKDVVETACALYLINKSAKEWNQDRQTNLLK